MQGYPHLCSEPATITASYAGTGKEIEVFTSQDVLADTEWVNKLVKARVSLRVGRSQRTFRVWVPHTASAQTVLETLSEFVIASRANPLTCSDEISIWVDFVDPEISQGENHTSSSRHRVCHEVFFCNFHLFFFHSNRLRCRFHLAFFSVCPGSETPSGCPDIIILRSSHTPDSDLPLLLNGLLRHYLKRGDAFADTPTHSDPSAGPAPHLSHHSNTNTGAQTGSGKPPRPDPVARIDLAADITLSLDPSLSAGYSPSAESSSSSTDFILTMSVLGGVCVLLLLLLLLVMHSPLTPPSCASPVAAASLSVQNAARRKLYRKFAKVIATLGLNAFDIVIGWLSLYVLMESRDGEHVAGNMLMWCVLGVVLCGTCVSLAAGVMTATRLQHYLNQLNSSVEHFPNVTVVRVGGNTSGVGSRDMSASFEALIVKEVVVKKKRERE